MAAKAISDLAPATPFASNVATGLEALALAALGFGSWLMDNDELSVVLGVGVLGEDEVVEGRLYVDVPGVGELGEDEVGEGRMYVGELV